MSNIGTMARELWDAYPPKGQTHKHLFEQYYCAMLFPLGDEERAEFHEKVIACWRHQGNWAVSQIANEGRYLPSISRWVADRRWLDTITETGPMCHCAECRETRKNPPKQAPLIQPANCSLCMDQGETVIWDAEAKKNRFVPCSCRGSV